MVRLLIIADDFTGALDTGVKFAESGAEVRVIRDEHYDFTCTSEQVSVLVMDAETRHISSQDAYRKVYHITKNAREAGIPYIYKKTDSALRGNIGSELTAVLDGSGCQVLHFLPAFPKMGRTTQNGIHYIDGIPVQESVFGKDPFEPVTCSEIPKMIAAQSKVSVRVVSDGIVMTGGEMAGVGKPEIAVYDAKTDDDMAALAHALSDAGQLGVLAGCAGMAETLPALLKLAGGRHKQPEFIPKLLVACGSVNPITCAQLDYAEKRGFVRPRLTPRQKLDPEYFQTEIGRTKARELLECYRNSALCILDSNDTAEEPDTRRYAQELGLDRDTLRVQIADTLGYLVRCFIENASDCTLLITGGDTLLGFMKQAQVEEMIPICEMAPGTVLSQFEIKGKVYKLISKSGGFGKENLIVELAEQILGEKKEGMLC